MTIVPCLSLLNGFVVCVLLTCKGTCHKGVGAGDGELLTAGTNESCQLGIKQHISVGSLVRVQALEALGARATAVGQNHLLAITKGRSLLSWGTSEFGQLGMSCLLHPNPHGCHPTLMLYATCVSPRAKTSSYDLMSRACSNPIPTSAGQGDGNSTAVVLPHAVRVDGRLGNDIEAVAAGVNHSLVMSMTGRISAFGDNSFEQLGGTPSQK
jgi:alpha-tubulin suppressor-like RCC1 family protein